MILLLDTSGPVCRCGLANATKLLVWEEIHEPMAHGERLAPMVQQQLAQANEKLSAIALVSGPGSYTGLRIGAGLAKGLAYGLHLPMYALPMTEVLALAALPLVQEAGFIQPVIDARRMEVYTARFNNLGERLSEDEALVIEDSFFEEPKYLIGDGVPKIREEFGEKKGIHYLELPPLGHAMQLAALKAVEHGNPIDTAYWEPHYLKTFQPGPKRSA